MPKLKKNTILPTEIEENEILKHAEEDGTNLSVKQLNEFKSASQLPIIDSLIRSNRGRPKLEKTKKTISIRLSQDTLEYFKSSGKGWQTRIDKILTKYVLEH